MAWIKTSRNFSAHFYGKGLIRPRGCFRRGAASELVRFLSIGNDVDPGHPNASELSGSAQILLSSSKRPFNCVYT